MKCKVCGGPGAYYKKREVRDGVPGTVPVFECKTKECAVTWSGDWRSKKTQRKEYIQRLRALRPSKKLALTSPVEGEEESKKI